MESDIMKRFSCGDVVPGCDATFVAETEPAILEQVGEHARQDHDITDVSPELANAVITAIRTE